MALDAADWTVSTAGDIRWTGAGTATNVTVIEFHRWLMDLADDAAASQATTDLLDITDDTPSDRSTDNIVTLINGYNVDDTAIEHIYDGSITQDSGDTVYSGLVVVGAVETGTELQIVQNNNFIRNYWGTGINADAAANILMRLMVKTRQNGVDIDAKRLRVQARELSNRYAEFSLTAGLGNATAAIFTSNDLNNQTAEATIAGWTTIANTEGLRNLDLDDDTIDEQYYSEWDLGSQAINDLYERTKWIQQRPSEVAPIAAKTGQDNVVDNATITGQAMEFTSRAQAEMVTAVKFFLKVGAGTPVGSLIAEIYTDSIDNPNTLIATSDPVLVGEVGAAYTQIEFAFNDQVSLTASTQYHAAIRNADGDGSNYIHVRGDVGGTGQSTDTAGWAATGGGDLDLEVYASPVQHDMPGALFRGPTHSFGYDTETGTPTLATNESLGWGTLIQVSGVTGTFLPGEAVHEDTATPTWKAEVLAYDAVDTSLLVRLESGSITGTDTFTAQESGAAATADSSVAPTGSGGGLMKVLAFEDDGTDGELYVQLLTGTAPVDSETLYVTEDSADSLPALNQSVDVSAAKLAISSRTISPEFIGASTGSALIGAYGIGMEKVDTTNNDQFFDLTNTLNTPPVTATFTVSGMTATGGRLLVAPRTGTAINPDHMVTDTALTGATETSISINPAGGDVPGIPAYAPATGILRITLDDGRERRVPYTAVDKGTDTFTIASTSFTGVNAAASGNGVYIAYIDDDFATDSTNFALINPGTLDLFVRFRDGRPASAIKTFENTAASITNAGGSATVIRTPDV